MLTKRLLIGLIGAALAAGACSLSTQDKPAPVGPSELGLAIAVSASPEVVSFSENGPSQSRLTITAKDAQGRPKLGVQLRLAMFVGTENGAVNVDYGTLMNKVLFTDNGGEATTIYTAPPPPPLTESNDKFLFIEVVPMLPGGGDYGNNTSRVVTLRLTRPGVILPPNPNVAASFFFSPGQPREDEPVQFDGSGSTGTGLTYAWVFGDGALGTGVRTTHLYSVAGSYSATLTVTDDRGTKDTSPPLTVTVTGAPDPTANFTVSPAEATVNQDVFFDGSLSTTPIGSGRTIVAYDWNFGDGQVGSGKTTAHKYAAAKTYTVVLNVRDSSGRRGTTARTIVVK